MVPITALITTKNEELNIEKCLKSIHGFVSQIYVIDSESDDNTVAIAKRYADEVVNLAYEHGRIIPWIFQWSLDNLDIKSEWVLILEADQEVTDGLKKELTTLFTKPRIEENGFFIRKHQLFRGSVLKFGGYGNKYLLKLFRKGYGELDPVEQDTRVYVKGKIGKLSAPLHEDNLKENDILFYLQKHLRYADAFAREEYRRRTENLQFKGQPNFFGTQDERTLWLKNIYYKMPLYVRPFLYFIYRYFFRLGIFDGKNGFIFHFLQAFWFRLVVDIRLDELIRADKSTHG